MSSMSIKSRENEIRTRVFRLMPDCTPEAWETLESIGDSIFSARCLFSFLSLYHLSSK